MIAYSLRCSTRGVFGWDHLRGLLLGADGALGVHGGAGAEDLLGQVYEGVVPVANGQALGFEQNAGLPIVGHTEGPVGSHKRLQQLPLALGHPRLMQVKWL